MVLLEESRTVAEQSRMFPSWSLGFNLDSTSRHVQLHLNVVVTLSRYGRMARGGEAERMTLE